MSYPLTDTVSSSGSDARSKFSPTNSEKYRQFRNNNLGTNLSWNLLKNSNSDDLINAESYENLKRIQLYKERSASKNLSKSQWDTDSMANVSDKCLPGRSGIASVLYKNCIYVFGGYRMRKRLNDFYKYDITENSWNKILRTKDTPSARENNPAVRYKNKMYIYGGYQGNKKWLGDFHSFNLDTFQWEKVFVKQKSRRYAPTNLFGISSGVDEEKGIIYYFGGYDGIVLYNKVYAFDIKHSKWIHVNQYGDTPSPRSCANAHIVDGYFYIFGGYNGKTSLNSLYQYHLETGIWTKIQYNVCGEKPDDGEEEEEEVDEDGEENGDEEIDEYTVKTTSKRITNARTSNKLKMMKYKDSIFYQKDAVVPSPRYFAASFLFNSHIYILGGYDGYSKRLNDFYKFDVGQRVWTKISTLNNFTGRSSMSAHVYKHVVYCIAGYDGKNVLNDVYALKLENIYVESSSYANDYKLMVNNPKCSDVVFVVQNRYVYACKAILSARCPYFLNLFNSYYNQENILSRQIPISIRGVSYEVFVEILSYLYTDQLSTNYTLNDYIHILIAAIKFDIFRLVQLCEMIICDHVNHSNVLDIAILSYRNYCHQLCRYCVDYLLNNKLLNDNKINKLVQEPQLLAEIYRRSITC